MSRLSAGNPCLELLAREPLAVERERDEPLQLEDRSLSILFFGGGGGPVLSEREIGLVRNGSAGSTNTLGEREGRNAPSPPFPGTGGLGAGRDCSPGHTEVMRFRE